MGKAQVTLQDGRQAIIEYEGKTPPSEVEMQSYINSMPASSKKESISKKSDKPTQLANIAKYAGILAPANPIISGISNAVRMGAQAAGIKNPIEEDLGKSAVSGFGESMALPAVGRFSNERLRPLIGKQPLEKEQLEKTLEPLAVGYDPKTLTGHVTKFGSSLALPALLFPEATLANALKGGALIGATTAVNQEGNPLSGALVGAATGGLTHGAIKGGGQLIDKALLKLSAIPDYLTEAATQKGSKILNYFKTLEEGNPKIQAQNLWEDIRKPFNKAVLEKEKELGQGVGLEKQKLFDEYRKALELFDKNAQENNILKINPQISKVEEKLNKTISDRQYKSNPLENTIKGYIDEIKEGVTPERADELISQIDDLVNYKKSLGDFNEFDKSFQIMASDLRKSLRNELDARSLGLQEANKKYSENLTKEAATGIEGVKLQTPKEAQLASREISLLQQAVKNPTKGRLRELIEELPLGKETLQNAEQADLAQLLQSIETKGEGMPLGFVGLILRLASGIPRNISINKIMPKMLEKSAGTYMPNAYNNAIQKVLELQTAKAGGYIDAQQYKDRR